MKLNVRRVTAGLLAIGAAVVVSGGPVVAQNADQTGSGLQITPTRHEVSVQAGAQKTIVIGLKNVTNGNVTAKAVVNDFATDNDTGTPKIITDTKVQTPRTVKKFLKGVQDTPLAKGEVKNVNIVVDVPTGTAPGAYYGIVRYQAVPESSKEQPNSVSLTASVGTIVLLDVPGETTEAMTAVAVKPELKGKTGSFFRKAPDKMGVELKNTGNTFLKPFGKVTISKSGGKEVFSYELNNTDPRSNVLPASTRIFRDPIKNVSGFGKYAVVANIGYGQGGQVVTLKTTFWIVPTAYIVAAAGVIIALLALGIMLYLLAGKHKKA